METSTFSAFGLLLSFPLRSFLDVQVGGEIHSYFMLKCLHYTLNCHLSRTSVKPLLSSLWSCPGNHMVFLFSAFIMRMAMSFHDTCVGRSCSNKLFYRQSVEGSWDGGFPLRVLQLSHASGLSHYDLLFTEDLLVLTFFCCCPHAPNEHILALDYYASGLMTVQNIILPILQMRRLKLWGLSDCQGHLTLKSEGAHNGSQVWFQNAEWLCYSAFLMKVSPGFLAKARYLNKVGQTNQMTLHGSWMAGSREMSVSRHKQHSLLGQIRGQPHKEPDLQCVMFTNKAGSYSVFRGKCIQLQLTSKDLSDS